jgi:4-alpha-glucanotransferase
MTKKKAVTKSDTEKEKSNDVRNAGILLHITSLPSLFGIGDMGPEARKFVDFLHKSNQRYWQLLPLNPIGGDQSYSPYSSISSMAGNVLLISPEQLVSEDLLSKADDRSAIVMPTGKVDFRVAIQFRQTLLQKAFQNFLAKKI